MGSLGVVMMSPSFDQHLGFTERGEDLGVQQLVPEFTVEAFVVAVFPGAPRRDVEGFDPNLGQPFPPSSAKIPAFFGSAESRGIEPATEGGDF